MTFSVKDLQARFSVSQHTILHWLATGQLKSLNVGRDPGKKRARYRVTESALAEFEQSRATAAPASRTRRRRHHVDDVIEFIK